MKPVLVLLFLTALLSCAAVRPGAAFAQTKEQELRTDDMPALLRAAAAGRVAEVRTLLQSGADVNEALDGIGLTALMLAAGGVIWKL
jgi:hypothetical protein